MQKNRRRGSIAIGEKQAQKHVEKQTPTRTYLEPIRNTMQKPIEGLLSNAKNEGGGVTIGAFHNQKHVEKGRKQQPKVTNNNQPLLKVANLFFTGYLHCATQSLRYAFNAAPPMLLWDTTWQD